MLRAKPLKQVRYVGHGLCLFDGIQKVQSVSFNMAGFIQ